MDVAAASSGASLKTSYHATNSTKMCAMAWNWWLCPRLDTRVAGTPMSEPKGKGSMASTSVALYAEHEPSHGACTHFDAKSVCHLDERVARDTSVDAAFGHGRTAHTTNVWKIACTICL